jgi:hypothetical protein
MPVVTVIQQMPPELAHLVPYQIDHRITVATKQMAECRDSIAWYRKQMERMNPEDFKYGKSRKEEVFDEDRFNRIIELENVVRNMRQQKTALWDRLRKLELARSIWMKGSVWDGTLTSEEIQEIDC